MSSDCHRPEGLTDILDSLAEASSGARVSVGDIVNTFRYRSFGPLILAPALVVLLPTGMIPGVPSVMASCIVLVTIQMLFSREAPWLPNRIERLSLHRGRFRDAVQSARGVTTFIDRHIHARLRWFASPAGKRLTAGFCLVLAVTIIPLEAIPFAAAIPAACIALMSLGISTEDGLLVVLGLVALGVGGTLVWALS